MPAIYAGLWDRKTAMSGTPTVLAFTHLPLSQNDGDHHCRVEGSSLVNGHDDELQEEN